MTYDTRSTVEASSQGLISLSSLVMATVSTILQPLFSLLFLSLYWAVPQSCPILWNTMDYSLPSSSLYGIFQARILEWVAIPISRGSFWPRNWNWLSLIAGRFFTIWATMEAPYTEQLPLKWCMEDSCLRFCHLRKCIYLEFIIRQFILT